jgi:hypothetical protein
LFWSRAVLVVLGVATVALIPSLAVSKSDNAPVNEVIARQLAIERGDVQPAKFDVPLSGGLMTAIQEAFGGGPATAAAAGRSRGRSSGSVPPSSSSNGCPNVFKGDVANVRVNQDCTLRRQAEEWVGVNPRDFSNVLAGQNDSRIGFNHCGYDWSLDRGESWGDTGTAPPPFWQELLPDGHTADACSDPAGTFDHLGNAYVTGVFFDITSPANGIFVAKSNAPFKGRFYHTPFSELSFQEYRATPMGHPASDSDAKVAHDKELMVADTRPGSRKQGRVYVTWTRFEAVQVGAVTQRSPIVFSQSTDGGARWSRAIIISGASGSFCTAFSGTEDNPNACDQDQGSHPVVGPDGTIYVIFGNGNTPEGSADQVLVVRCPATNECDKESDWQGPFRVGDLVSGHPVGPSPEGCPAGRRCLPPNGYRVPQFTTMSISVDRSNNLYATWADFRNGKAPCRGAAATAKPPCNNDVFFSFSTNGGATWSPTMNVTTKFGETAQWQPWSDVMGDGSAVQVAFYDRHYGDCEFTGCNDITLATIANPRSSKPSIRFRRITTASMPNLTPANNPVQAGFLGDYMWVEVSHHNFDQRTTHIVWADTRPLFGSAPEEDIYYASVKAEGDEGVDDDDHGGDRR